MNIKIGSAEMIACGDLQHLLFGCPTTKYEKMDDNTIQILTQTGKCINESKDFPIKFEDIQNLPIWQNEKKEVESLYYQSQFGKKKDLLGNTWLEMGGTGYYYLYNLGRNYD